MTLVGVFESSSWTYETSIWAKYCRPLKTDMTLENPHCQKDPYIDSFMVGFSASHVSELGGVANNS